MLLRNKIFAGISLPIIFIVVVGIVEFFYMLYWEMPEKIRYENILGISTALHAYSSDYDPETFPPMNQWCDKLIEEADCTPSMFQGFFYSQEGICGYALNAKLDGLEYSKLDGDIVLAFEAKGPWNLNGGPELIDRKQRKIAVVFTNGEMKFVKPEEIDKLRWEP